MGRTILVASALLGLSATAARPQHLGKVIGVDDVSRMPEDVHLHPKDDLGKSVVVGAVVVTDEEGAKRGRVSIVMEDRSTIQVGPKSRVVFSGEVRTPKGARSVFDLEEGRVRVVAFKGSLLTICTPESCADSVGTDFIVSYDPVLRHTRVIGVEGTVLVRNRGDSTAAAVEVTANHATSVSGVQGPEKATEVGDTEVSSALADFQMIGDGYPEGLSVDHRLLIEPVEGPSEVALGGGKPQWAPLRDDELPGGVDPPLFDPQGGLLVDLFD